MSPFLSQDTSTQGNWINIYGNQGYDVISKSNSYVSLPAGVTVTPAGQSTYTWATSANSATQALELPGGASRIAACWYSPTSFTVDVDVTNGQSYNLELYVLDYDSTGRSEQIQLTNVATGAILGTESVSNFSDGAYINWRISGNTLITITNTGPANAVLSGLFLDPPPAVTTVTSVDSSLNASTYGQSVTFTATVSDTGGGLATGTVEFYDGSTDLGPGTPLSGSGNSETSTFTTSTLTAGVHRSITAVFTPTGNFVASAGVFSQTVTRAALIITATAVNKVYDGTTTATVSLSDNRVAGDTFTDTFTSATFLTKNAGTGQTVEVTGITISGPGASNYTFNTSATTTANITPAVLTITAIPNTKVYDGTTTAAAIPTVSGLKGSDTVTGLTETYASPSVGTGIALSVATYTVNDGNGGHNYAIGLVVNNNGVITAPTPASAVFLKEDTTTEGNWINTYGTQGYEVIGNATSLPSYATVTPSGQTTYTWTASTTDPRALQQASGTGRIAAAWYSATSFTVDVDFSDGKTHDLELYFLDWDTTGRSEQVQISNAVHGGGAGYRDGLVVPCGCLR